MPFRITAAEYTAFPSTDAVEASLSPFALSSARVGDVLTKFTCQASVRDDYGYQQSLAQELERHLGAELTRDGALKTSSQSYSHKLNEQADLALQVPGKDQRIFFEIEFRPNVEKDLVKFQIGHNNGCLAAGILILALKRSAINRRYTTMPEYGKFRGLIRELNPNYPLLLYGIDGEFCD